MQKTTYERYTVDVFTDKKRPWMEKYSIREMSGPHGAYFSFQHLPSSEAMAIERNSHRYHIKTRKYVLNIPFAILAMHRMQCLGIFIKKYCL